MPGPAASIPVTKAPLSNIASVRIPPPQPTSKNFLFSKLTISFM